jgi:hypothetical protein
MPSIHLLSTLALVLLPVAAGAQTPTTPTTPPAAPAITTSNSGLAEVGVRGTRFKGDGARYERYRDLGDGLFLQALRLNRDNGVWLFEATAANAGRRDQRFSGSIVKPGRFNSWVIWDQVPMLMSRTTRTLFVEDFDEAPGVLTIPDAIQAAVQAQGNAAMPGLFAANGIGFDTRSRRHIGQGGVEFIATPELTVRSTVQFTSREGTLPYGGSFGHSSLVELPAPIRHSLTDFDSSAEFVRGRWLARGGFTGSWFHNDVTSVTFDNPFRATDSASTPSLGRSSLAPSNSLLGVNGMLSVKLPSRSRATAFVSVGSLKDAGELLIAQTVNTFNINAGTILPLPRNQVNGEARTVGASLSFTSRPNDWSDVSVRFRSYDYDNRTPVFVLPQRVAYDNAPGAATFSTLGGRVSPAIVETEPFGVVRRTFDADFRVTPGFGTAGVGYTRLREHRSHRFFETTTDNVLRLTFDAIGNRWFSVRTKYEHGQRRADISEEELLESELELFNIGEQPALRQFDLANRNRDRVTIVGSVMPSSVLMLHASVAAGKDDYTESVFGLRDNTHRVYSAGVDATPHERVNVGLSYSFERYVALLHSRSANPPSGAASVDFPTFLDLSAQPTSTLQIADNRGNWANEGADRAHSFIASAEFLNLVSKVDVRVSYDLNRTRSLYTYTTGPDIPRTLPEDVPPPTSTLRPPEQLPLVTSDLQRGTLDVIYNLTSRVGVGVSYWHERYRVTDFTLDIDANPELARGAALLLGYLYLPYTANSVFGRLIVKF